MRKNLLRALLCGLLTAGLLSVTAGAVVEPTDAFYVADYAGVLSADTEQHIIDQNEVLFDSTGGQIVVVTVDFMDGMDSADYAMAVAENWGGIGDEDLDNGFLLVYAVGENKVWAMAGAGLEDALTASRIESYLEEYFYDGYDAGEYDQATRDFFDAIYGWYESYYAGSISGTTSGAAGQGTYVPNSDPYYDAYYGPGYGYGGSFSFLGWVVGGIILLIILVCVIDGMRYRSYRRRYLMPGMPPPPFVYRPFIFGWPRAPRPPRGPRPPQPPGGPRPPAGGGFTSGGSFRGGGAGRGGSSFGGSGSFRGGGGSFRGGGGSFRGGGGSFRGGGAGRR